MYTFGDVLEEIHSEVCSRHKYAATEWVKLLLKFNKISLSPNTLEEGATIGDMGDSTYEKHNNKKWVSLFYLLIDFIKIHNITNKRISNFILKELHS